MGRRSQHTPDELKELILGAARGIIDQSGFDGLSAREIARAIGYAPGTLYNMYRNLDEIVLRVETRVLNELDGRVADAMNGQSDHQALRNFGRAHVEFAYQTPTLWQLIQRHHPQQMKEAPDWYLERLYAPVTRIEPVLGKVTGTTDIDEQARNARILWSAVHGVVNVATTRKFGTLPMATTLTMVDSITDRLLTGTTDLSASRQLTAPRRNRHLA
jgi:AcrR family transcriptional regulator